MECSDHCFPSRSLGVCLTTRYLPQHPLLCPVDGRVRAACRVLGVAVRGPPSARFVDRSSSASQVPREPQYAPAPLVDPAKTAHRLYISGMLLTTRPGQLLNWTFRGSVTQLTRSLSTLRRRGSPPADARLGSGGRQLCRVGLGTHWVPIRDFTSSPCTSFLGSVDPTRLGLLVAPASARELTRGPGGNTPGTREKRNRKRRRLTLTGRAGVSPASYDVGRQP